MFAASCHRLPEYPDVVPEIRLVSRHDDPRRSGYYHTIVWHTIVYGLKVCIRRTINGMKNPLLQFGERVKKVRLEQGISQEDLAERAELHRNYVSQIECGRRNLSLLNILKLARALKVSASSLIENIR